MAKSIMQSRRLGLIARLRDFFSGPAYDPIGSLMIRRVGEVQRGEYDPIGIITDIYTAAGFIIFPPPDQRRPSLGRFHSDNQVDLIDPWEYPVGLPPWYELTLQACPECKALCNVCRFTSDPDIPVRMFIAGEKKFFRPGKRPCIHGHNLNTCGGAGKIGGQPCPTCDGSGEVDCERCGGTGMMSTGHTADGKICQACGGTERIRVEHVQEVSRYYNPDLSESGSGYLAIGPIISVQLTSATWQGQADTSGNYPHLVIPTITSRGSRATISLVGVLKKQESVRRVQGTGNREQGKR